MKVFSSFFDSIKQKRGYFTFLLILTLTSIVLGVYAGINVSGGILVVDLTNISYIQFLTGETSFVSMIFKLMVSLFTFFILIHVCNFKPFLLPFAIIFYMYLIYSQTVVLISIIMLYGFFNCIIVCILLFIYILIITFIFILHCIEVNKFCGCQGYFKQSFNLNGSNVLICAILLVIVTLIFCTILAILKSFVILLVY